MQKVENLYFIYFNFIHLFLYAVKQFLETVKQTDRESFVGPLLCRSNMYLHFLNLLSMWTFFKMIAVDFYSSKHFFYTKTIDSITHLLKQKHKIHLKLKWCCTFPSIFQILMQFKKEKKNLLEKLMLLIVLMKTTNSEKINSKKDFPL